MRDLQQRLASLGISTEPDLPGALEAGTIEAVRTFQRQRGLRVDGICGPETWGVLVEAGYRAGDRLLYYTSPPLRGDDVADLQRRLGALGFDVGRLDGIFGPQTQEALLDFQRNAGLPTDALAGPTVWATLERWGSRSGGPEHAAALREREALREAAGTLEGRRVVVGDPGGLSALAAALTRALTAAGAVALPVHHPDGRMQAAQANGAGADVFVAVVAWAEPACTACYYAAHGVESAGGRRLAEAVVEAVAPVLGLPGETVGMAIPVLRETRMPAVVCELGPPPALVEQGPEVAAALTQALTRWVRAPVEA